MSMKSAANAVAILLAAAIVTIPSGAMAGPIEEYCHAIGHHDCYVIDQELEAAGLVPGEASVWPDITFNGKCEGRTSTTEFQATLGEIEVDTPLVDVRLTLLSVEKTKVYYQVTCDIEATPIAWGENGILRTVWLVQDDVRTSPCEYTGLPGNTFCPAAGETGAASTTPRVGSLEDGFAPSGVEGCWVGPSISAEGHGYQGLDDLVENLPVGADCGNFGITWVSEDEALEALVDLLNDLSD